MLKLQTKLKKVVIVCLCAIALFSSLNILTANAFGEVNGSIAYAFVKNLQKIESNWCWAASSSSFLSYHGIYVSQTTFCSQTLGEVTNRGANLFELNDGLNFYRNTEWAQSELNRNDLFYLLSASKPIIASYVYYNQLGSINGHIVVIDSYDKESDTLEIMDPDSGSKVMYTYDKFYDGSGWLWNSSFY